jgi:2-dehydro-3-deoxyphosphooctonate aldolase (KDO 8-P synthase)
MSVSSPPVPHRVAVGDVVFGNDRPLALLAGPCAMESRQHALDMAGAIAEIAGRFGMGFVYKTSFDKANRTSASSARGVGLAAALPVFAAVREQIGCPVLTDVHTEEQCIEVAPVVDVLQIPAFLCRQTDLLVACARTGVPVNVKKGQFLSPAEMEHVVEKLRSAGAAGIMLTERGTVFGYQRLVNDFIGVADMADFGHPVCFDVTHSTQLPGAGKGVTAGRPDRARHLARAATAVGVNALFLETHPDPASARSDAATQQPFSAVDRMLREVVAIRQAMEIVGTT